MEENFGVWIKDFQFHYNEKNSLIIFYIKKYTDILANSLSISLKDDFEYIRKKCLSFKTEKFIPTSNKNNKNSFNKRYDMSKEKAKKI